MSLMRYSPLYLVVIVTTLSFVFCSFVQAQSKVDQLQNTVKVRPRMKVIEVAPEVKTSHFYTILGAVKRSGVFQSHHSRIPLAELLDSAGGLEGVSQSSIRIVRNGQAGLQLFYLQDDALDQELQSSDLVVVVPGVNQNVMGTVEDQYIPVACLGLSERPVVLPVSAEIRNLDQLLLKLRQSEELKKSVRLLDPLGKPQTERLIPGSVLFFEPSLVDRKRLIDVELFPPAVPIGKSDEQNPTPEEKQMLVSEGPDSLGFSISPLNEAQKPQFMQNETEPAADSVVVTPAQVPPLLTNPAKSVITIEEPATLNSRLDAESVDHLAANRPKSLMDEFEKKEQFELSQIDLLPENGTTPLKPNFIPGIQAGNQMEAVMVSTAPPPPESRVMRKFESLELGANLEKKNQPLVGVMKANSTPQGLLVGVDSKTESAKSKPNSELSLSQYLPIVLCLGGLGMVCLIISIVWSQNEQRQQREMASSENQVSRQKESEEKLQDAVYSNQLKLILNQCTPVIEEAVLLPQEVQIHGEPVGQRRIIIHEKEDTLRGPHFHQTRKEASLQKLRNEILLTSSNAQAATENKTQEGLKPAFSSSFDVVVPAEDTSDSEFQTQQNFHVNPKTAAQIVSTSPDRQSTYDVVVPQHSEFEGLDPGPLERALRMLAREKNV